MLRRELAGDRDDFIMVDGLSSTQYPSGIRVCQDENEVGYLASQRALLANLDPAIAATAVPLVAPVIGGFQVIYGTGSSRVTGPAHGDVSKGNCVWNDFPSNNPSAINVYTDDTDPLATSTLMGIQLQFTIAGQTNPSVINLGATDEIDMTKYEYTFAATDSQ